MDHHFFHYSKRIAPFVEAELQQAQIKMDNGASQEAFKHLENAHVLGQASTYWHVKTHYRMLLWGWKEKQAGEVWGQLIRIAGAASKTALGLIPTGNTGGANVSPFKPMPIDAPLAAIIRDAKG